MLELIRAIANAAESGREIVSATVAGHAGSAPRGAGSRMLVWADGAIAGSVGGGVLEAEVMRAAHELFAAGGIRIMKFDLTGEEAAGSGMICGGAVTVLLELVRPGDASAAAFKDASDMLERGGRAVMVAELREQGQNLRATRRRVLSRDSLEAAELDAAEAEVVRSARECESARIVEAGDRHYFIEPLAPPHSVIIAGAGHVGLFTAALASRVGFRTVVVDDRADFANRMRFPEADEIRVVSDFEHCLDDLEIGEATFILILTRGHVHDKEVLAAALSGKAGYVGMIGSRRKRDAIYEALAAEGVSRRRLAEVHSPVGLSIGAETPQEIAVSIVAEMIRVRADMRK